MALTWEFWRCMLWLTAWEGTFHWFFFSFFFLNCLHRHKFEVVWRSNHINVLIPSPNSEYSGVKVSLHDCMMHLLLNITSFISIRALSWWTPIFSYKIIHNFNILLLLFSLYSFNSSCVLCSSGNSSFLIQLMLYL